MKSINDIINEKFKISKNTKITDSDIIETKRGNTLWTEIQNEIDKNAGYQSYDFSDGQTKYKYGILIIEDDFVAIEGFNSPEDLEELFNTDPKLSMYDDLVKMKVFDVDDNPDGNGKIIRVW